MNDEQAELLNNKFHELLEFARSLDISEHRIAREFFAMGMINLYNINDDAEATYKYICEFSNDIRKVQLGIINLVEDKLK